MPSIVSLKIFKVSYYVTLQSACMDIMLKILKTQKKNTQDFGFFGVFELDGWTFVRIFAEYKRRTEGKGKSRVESEL